MSPPPFTPTYVREGKPLGQHLYEDMAATSGMHFTLTWAQLGGEIQQRWDDIATRTVEVWGGPTLEEQPPLPRRRGSRHRNDHGD